MPVVNTKSDLFRDVIAGEIQPDPLLIHGDLKFATGTVVNTATDETGSIYEIARLPSHVVMHGLTEFDVENWGFARVVIGSREVTDQIADQNRVTAPAITPFAVGDANHGKRLWEVLGLAEDPGGQIAICAHAIANATGAGAMPFQIAWIENPGAT